MRTGQGLSRLCPGAYAAGYDVPPCAGLDVVRGRRSIRDRIHASAAFVSDSEQLASVTPIRGKRPLDGPRNYPGGIPNVACPNCEDEWWIPVPLTGQAVPLVSFSATGQIMSMALRVRCPSCGYERDVVEG